MCVFFLKKEAKHILNIWSSQKREILKESMLVEGRIKTVWIHLVTRCDQFLACVVPCHPRATWRQSFGYVYPIFWGQNYQQSWWWLDVLRLHLLCSDIGHNSTPTIVTRSKIGRGGKEGRRERGPMLTSEVIRLWLTRPHNPGVTWRWSHGQVTPCLVGRLI